MAYNRTTWTDGVTDLSAANLNKMETGIADAHTEITTVNNNLTATNNTLKSSYIGARGYTEGDISKIFAAGTYMIGANTTAPLNHGVLVVFVGSTGGYSVQMYIPMGTPTGVKYRVSTNGTTWGDWLAV